MFCRSLDNLNITILVAKYWRLMSKQFPYMMRERETMAIIVRRAYDLKSDDNNLKATSFNEKSCTKCDDAAYNDAEHIVVGCSNIYDLRCQMVHI